MSISVRRSISLKAVLEAKEPNTIIDYLKTAELEEVEKWLESKEIDVNAIFGETKLSLLMIAVQVGRIKIVKTLLEHGANPNLVDAVGRTASGYVNRIDVKDYDEKKEIAIFLKKNGAKNFSGHPVKVIRALGYANILANFGLCHGLASVGIDYMMRGKEGIHELDELLLALGDSDTDAVVNEINEIQKFRVDYVKEHRIEIKTNIEANLFGKLRKSHESKTTLFNVQAETGDWEDPALPPLLYKTLHEQMTPEKANDAIYNTLDNLVKSQFIDTTEEERKGLVENIIKFKLDRKQCAENQKQVDYILNIKRFRNRAYKNIYREMIEGLINILVQKQLDVAVRKELKENKQFKSKGVLLDAPNYLQSISISQDTPKEYLEKNIPFAFWDQNVFVSLPLVSSVGAEKQGLTAPQGGSFSESYNKAELKEFFHLWREAFKANKISNPVAFMLDVDVPNHCISIAYLPVEDEWALNGYYAGRGTVTTQDDGILADRIFVNLGSPDCKYIEITGRAYSTKKDEKKIQSAIKHINQFHNIKLHTLSEEEVKSENAKKEKKAIALFLLWVVFSCVILLPAILTFPLIIKIVLIIGIVATVIMGGLACYVLSFSSEQTNEAVRANAERDAGYPATSRDRTPQKLGNSDRPASDATYSFPEEKKQLTTKNYRDESAISTGVRAIPPGLFIKEHSDFLALQKEWRSIWSGYYNTDKILTARIKKPSFFNSFYFLGYRQHYEKIQGIFDRNHGKYCSNKDVYQTELQIIYGELEALLKCTLPKQTLIRLGKMCGTVREDVIPNRSCSPSRMANALKL